jgi:hypothetical protein
MNFKIKIDQTSLEFQNLSKEAQDFVVRASLGEFGETGPPQISPEARAEIAKWALSPSPWIIHRSDQEADPQMSRPDNQSRSSRFPFISAPALLEREIKAEELVHGPGNVPRSPWKNLAEHFARRTAEAEERLLAAGYYWDGEVGEFLRQTGPKMDSQTLLILQLVQLELMRARQKFPQSEHSMAALTEEIGELAKALLDEPLQRVQAEAVQVAVMAIRVATEGDPSFFNIRNRKGLQ